LHTALLADALVAKAEEQINGEEEHKEDQDDSQAGCGGGCILRIVICHFHNDVFGVKRFVQVCQ
jgi:hypothetical protein